MSALQALTIYILVATLEEDNLSPSIDAKMLHVMMVSFSNHFDKRFPMPLKVVAGKIEDPNYAYSIAQYGDWHQSPLLNRSKSGAGRPGSPGACPIIMSKGQV